LVGVGVVAAAVAIATVTLVALVPETFTVAGVKLQLAPVGSPEQESVTAPLKPFMPARLTCTLAVWPLLTLTLLREQAGGKQQCGKCGDQGSGKEPAALSDEPK
jgi:hypothetical protein